LVSTCVPVLWVDQDLLIINKPPGLLSLPDGYDPSLPHVKALLFVEYGTLWIVHRLDRFTSGVMILARNPDAHHALNTQFQSRKVKKVYLALVHGSPEWDKKLVQLPLKIDVGKHHRTIVDIENGKESKTQFRVLERFEQYCLIEARPSTGRRHQIRAHLCSTGYPIACDSLYGGREKFPKSPVKGESIRGLSSVQPIMERLALHASSIQFVHPGDGRPCVIEGPLAHDFDLALTKLRS
jgi:RluA family pseudouridine synthase